MFSLMSRRKNEEGVALVIAILIIVIVAGIMSTVTMASVSSSQKSTQSREWIYHGQAVESAIQNALTFANSPYGVCADPHDDSNPNCIAFHASTNDAGEYNWKYGLEGEMRWQWRAEGVTIPDGSIAYDIYAVAYDPIQGQDKNPRAIKVRLQQQGVAEGYEISNKGEVSYQLAPGNLFDWSIFATDSIELRPGAVINAKDGANIEEGSIATNGIANFPQGGSTAMSINNIEMLNSAQNTATDRCRVKGSAVPSELCAQPGAVTYNETGVSLEGIYNKVMSKCMVPGATSLGNWRASENVDGGAAVLKSGCYDSIVVDANTVVAQANGNAPTTSSPAEIFIKPGGTYDQSRGTSLKADSTEPNNPALVRFYSAGTNFRFSNSGLLGPGGDSSFVGLVAGNNMKCSSFIPVGATTATAKTVSVIGGFACKTVEFGSKVTVTRDIEASQDLKPNTSGAYVIWHTTTYQTTDLDTVMGNV